MSDSTDRDPTLAGPPKTLIGRLRRRLELRLRAYYLSPWVNRRYVSDASPIIIGGSDRSGTTLLRASIDSHPEIAAGPESWVFVYQLKLADLAQEYEISLAELEAMRARASCLAEFIETFFEAFRRREGKPRWCEKSPRNIRRLDWIWRHFPKARVIHIIRDGRDVACSLRNHPRHVLVDGEYVPTHIDRPIAECIDWWARYVRDGLAHRGDPRYLEVRYEELVSDYAGTLSRICEHVNVGWSPELLKREELQGQKSQMEIVNPEVRAPLYDAAMGRWQRDLSPAEQDVVHRRHGDLLAQLGYAVP